MTNKIISRFRDFHGAKKKYAFTVAAITILCLVTILYSPSVAFARGSNTWPQREGYYVIPQKKAMPYYWGEEKIDSKLTHEDVKVNKSNESLVNNELNRATRITTIKEEIFNIAVSINFNCIQLINMA